MPNSTLSILFPATEGYSVGDYVSHPQAVHVKHEHEISHIQVYPALYQDCFMGAMHDLYDDATEGLLEPQVVDSWGGMIKGGQIGAQAGKIIMFIPDFFLGQGYRDGNDLTRYYIFRQGLIGKIVEVGNGVVQGGVALVGGIVCGVLGGIIGLGRLCVVNGASANSIGKFAKFGFELGAVYSGELVRQTLSRLSDLFMNTLRFPSFLLKGVCTIVGSTVGTIFGGVASMFKRKAEKP